VTTPDRLPPARAWRSRLPNDSITRQFGRFALVGVSNTVVSFVAYAILIRIGVFYGAAGALAFALGAANGYILNRRWTRSLPTAAGRLSSELEMSKRLPAVSSSEQG
jgi:hypothetical protein